MDLQALRRLQVTHNHIIESSDTSSSSDALESNDVCGIIGFIGKEEAINYLIEGLSILENRGYDSAGVTTISPSNELVTSKYASLNTTSDAISRLKSVTHLHKGHVIGIAHTRWATHGGKTDKNAHPHHDDKNRVAVVHNGVIENSSNLREMLEKKGVVFRSETDTEVIAQLIGMFLDQGFSTIDAVKETQKQLQGTWGVAVVSKEAPDQIIALKNGSPLLIGIGKDRMFIASEAGAFARHTKEFISMENGEIAVLRADGHSLDLSRIELAAHEQIQLSPEPYPHWTIKEIMEQPMSISRALNYGGRIFDDSRVKLGGLEEAKELLLPIKNLIITGCGTSYFAGQLGAKIMRYLGAFDTIQVIDAAEVSRDSLPHTNAGILMISQSGETKDVHRVMSLAGECNTPCFSVVNAVGSLIARGAICGVYLNAGREHAVASTKAFTSQVTVLSLIANWFAQHRGLEEGKRRHLIESLHRLPTNLGMALRVRDQCHRIAQKLYKKQSMFVLGKGLSEPIAYEGALKIKEITYIHAEGYSGGALKHGPFALIEQGTPIILIVLDDAHAQLMRIAAEEVKARGAYTIIITNNQTLAKHIADDTILIPSNGVLTSLLAAIPLQLIAYEVACLKGIDPDRPKNLAKAVTTD
ncbi:glutamine-fructose-6-phosphate transaminase [Heterostelium album PN500]|uniref:Glutamine--fructose-6-phosphate aminotransferase [isomerizing] n=1 Tax=Heterostelium pallidum (strain ATCC 26659 / Pp 5 / PN500) TaxID=670386 RepID=D3BT14_HETP5|nr:glutamine-fructose-6-phosphate transaminase [Heterostelium album PN500]EFA75629.1 glutamine-fructose-6-phosphate transaminase [Heterostelium album PN500]|eukprot:XP_020427763.1 glutamine-fructose-6-phosphate transaminase [Heterostelium album PN500]